MWYIIDVKWDTSMQWRQNLDEALLLDANDGHLSILDVSNYLVYRVYQNIGASTQKYKGWDEASFSQIITLCRKMLTHSLCLKQGSKQEGDYLPRDEIFSSWYKAKNDWKIVNPHYDSEFVNASIEAGIFFNEDQYNKRNSFI